MDNIDIETEVRQLLDAGTVAQHPREYLGASAIGQSCEAEIALKWRHFPTKPLEQRQSRVFRDGHRIEADAIADLVRAGHLVSCRDENGDQFEAVCSDGHVKMHADGFIEIAGNKLLLEIKSMNAERWENLARHGVAQTDRAYRDQMMLMMREFEVERALLVAYNKNTSQYWTEVVEHDPFLDHSIDAKINRVLGKSDAVMRYYRNPDCFSCRLCDVRDACREEPKVTPTCRNCANSYALEDNGWGCRVGEVIEWPSVDPVDCMSWRVWRPL